MGFLITIKSTVLKIKLLSLSIILFTFFGSIQETKKEMLCDKTWELKFIQVGESKMPIPSDDQYKMWMRFTYDGVHKVNTNQGVKEGKWEFSKTKDSLMITNYAGSVKSLKIDSISPKELVLTTTEMAGSGTMYFTENTEIKTSNKK